MAKRKTPAAGAAVCKGRERIPFLYRKAVRLDSEERAHCIECADAALNELKRLKTRQPLDSDHEFDLVSGLASYVTFLRHIASGRVVRYAAIFHIAGNMAAYMGHDRILVIIERAGFALDKLIWMWLTPLTSAIVGHRDSLAERFLTRFPQLAVEPYWQDAAARCVKFGTVSMLRSLMRHGVRLDRTYSSRRRRHGKDGVQIIGSPFYFAVACRRRDMQRELIRLGAIGDLTVGAPNTWLWGEGQNVFEVAIRTDNFKVADMCIRCGAVPPLTEENGVWVLNGTDASKDYAKFKWLKGRFPDADFPRIIRHAIEHGGSAGWFCREVLEDCGLGDLHLPEEEPQTIRYAPAAVPDRIGDFFGVLGKWPELIVPWYRKKPHLVRLMFAARGLNVFDEYAASLVPVFRFAKLNGLELWGHYTYQLEFMKLLDWDERRHLAPHMVEFGFPEAKLLNQWDDPKHPSYVGDEWHESQARAARATGKRAQRYMDDAKFNVWGSVSIAMSFVNILSEHADWALFQRWIMRGMNIYDERGVCDYPLIRCVNADLLKHLVLELGMLPRLKGRDGAYAMYHAIQRHDIDMVRVLLECGVPVNVRSRDYATPLREAILFGTDDIANLLYSRGGKNRDEEGRVFPVPPWVRTV